MGIVIIGSLNMDMVVRTSRAPEAGETLFGQAFALSPGGKGANQAAAAARLGAEVTMIGRVGKDGFGREMLEVMRKEGVHTEYIGQSETQATGVASIVVDGEGENRIIVVPGANLEMGREDIAALEPVIRQAEMVVMQLETDLSMCEEAASMAHSHGIPVILNPAPARVLTDELLQHVAYLTPNETEAGILAGMAVNSIADAEQAAQLLLQKGVENIIVTLGSKGALIVNHAGSQHIPGFPVQAVDTVAAGDSFNGALAYQLTSGKTLTEAVRFANAVGALAVGKQGAIPSLPQLVEVEQFLKESSRP
ncbi:ribokinase [Paenibacillus sp. PastF-1]|nr:ribokinase [Paenibacillus sp. PastF-2]MDF9851935.1 ribokinase [Paenibacillus sp. PastM-2]MDF9858499.1 ribokinase [Paenibacillus sp. PastF-1]MDH6483756.1 ribokinase [Paenibacillus sp. PastH-2]MDH6511138.1 ribokinase [Paenibacillus sp. PastM-3]